MCSIWQESSTSDVICQNFKDVLLHVVTFCVMQMSMLFCRALLTPQSSAQNIHHIDGTTERQQTGVSKQLQYKRMGFRRHFMITSSPAERVSYYVFQCGRDCSP